MDNLQDLAIEDEVSDVKGGPIPRVAGLFVYEEAKFFDNYDWDDVNQGKRLNCKSRPLGARVDPRVNYTVASESVPPLFTFFRRTHHVLRYPNAGAILNLVALVHYREVEVADPNPEVQQAGENQDPAVQVAEVVDDVQAVHVQAEAEVAEDVEGADVAEDQAVQAEEQASSTISGVVETGIKKKKVVLLGTGWAGTSFLKNLNNSQYEVQIISPRNYFAFTPLLPSVTCGTVEARSVVEPIRNIGKKKNVDTSYVEAESVKIDTVGKKVFCRSKQGLDSNGKKEFSVDYDYDYLVIATGAQSNTFNIPGVEEHCHFLKEVSDAQGIRKTVIDSFEKASLPEPSDEERKRILHFVVVGGGPTGVEFAAELHDFITEDLVKLYPRAKDSVRITLLEGAHHILTMFDKRITEFAEEKFSRDGIDVKLGSMVTKVNEKDIYAKTKAGEVSSIPYGMIVLKQIGQGNRRALATDEWHRVEGWDNIYALGDYATINQRKVMEDVSAIFSKADQDKSGTLTLKEFQEAEIEHRELLWHGSRLTYLTVPTQYVFLVRFIKVSMTDPEMENMVHFLAELGLMHYETLKFCPSMLAASAVYTARCSLNKSPAWTDTLKFHTGYSESEIIECSKVLAFHHSRCGESRLRAVYKKDSKAEKGGVALVSAAKSLSS
ncbi:unnamed protein product [Microthlaspi erraticum]|uniref:NADH:ubiquinone reductase (non-electrogenic) n=1 Tax=Microthlaspi erraticum TaxID=1685480 RepID=A0A6D2K382_9BRAS|nr:unnamed protein product [Microthlaspi erraticum]